MNEEKEFVRMMACVFCGKETGIALDRRMGRTKAFNDPKNLIQGRYIPDRNGCEECQEHFKDYKYFIGDCGHSGFIKKTALSQIFDRKAVAEIGKHNIFRMEKCFQCQGMIPADKVEHITNKK